MFFTVNLQQDQSKLSAYISTTLLENMEKTLEKGEKILLYINKRGAFSSMICEDCQYLFECPNCDVSLSVHHNPEHFLCHLCQHSYRIPLNCPQCTGTKLKSIGVGTQQIENIIKKQFPHHNTYRFDSDAMKNISEKKQALTYLDAADIIIGTKMITTGFDFEKIGLICVVLVEGELGSSSYNTEEKAYSNLKQLIGRGNRKSQETNIILQTFIPKNPTLLRLTQSNYKEFFTQTLEERKQYHYPPYCELVTLEYRSTDNTKALVYLEKIQTKLESHDTEKSYTFLRGTRSFKKNNSYHASLIIKGKDIRTLLRHIEKKILSEKSLSVIFHA